MWHEEMVFVAERSRLSYDPSSKNAACLALDGSLLSVTLAVNSIPTRVHNRPDRWDRPQKYKYVEHAERGCIYHAAALGIPTKGCTMVALWAACSDCARAIICAEIKELVTMRPSEEGAHPGWDDDIKIAMEMLSEAKVNVVYLDDILGVSVRRNGHEIML